MKQPFANVQLCRGELNRAGYFVWGVLLFALKYNIDRFVSLHWFGRRWSLLDYTKVGEYLWPSLPSASDSSYFLLLLAIGVPFMTAGVLLTLMRLRALRFSPWLVLLFFVPFIKIIFFLALCALPSRDKIDSLVAGKTDAEIGLGMLIPRSGAGSAAVGVVFSTISGAIAVWLGTTILRQYSWSLFVGIPFSLGFLSVLIYGYHEKRSFWNCMGISTLATLAAGAALLMVAIEGIVCLIMAAPLAVPMACIGGAVAYQIQKAPWWHGRSPRVFAIAVLPLLVMVVEHLEPPPVPMFSVTSSVVIEAPRRKVWSNVISFSELPPPNELLFHLGIAYPMRARIYGAGIGAERHCEFSTGAFIEPIECWDELRLLKFSVTQNPAPMQEWTPYSDLRPAHLDGFLESQAGQFHLVELPGGRTRLEGTTWYVHHMWPATYWRLWSDYIIHKIHLRVLRHVKHLSEEI